MSSLYLRRRRHRVRRTQPRNATLRITLTIRPKQTVRRTQRILLYVRSVHAHRPIEGVTQNYLEKPHNVTIAYMYIAIAIVLTWYAGIRSGLEKA